MYHVNAHQYADQNPPVKSETIRAGKSTLMLHCGAERVEYGDHAMTHVPEPKGRHHKPIAHQTLVDIVKDMIFYNGLVIENQIFGATKNGERFFALISLKSHHASEDYATIIGLRASHDQSLAAGLVSGAGVFVCDNLSFNGEVKIATKQTTHILDRLPTLVNNSVQKVADIAVKQAETFHRYQQAQITSRVADAAITDMVRRKIINPSHVGKVINEWDSPSHEEFCEHGRSVWRMHNAVTEVLKPTNGHTSMLQLPGRTIELSRFCDELAA